MASTAIRCPSIHLPPFHPQPRNPTLRKLQTLPFPPLKTSKFRVAIRSSSSSSSTPRSFPTTEAEVLKAVSESDESILPCVRTYENDLGRLTFVGAVDFQQALTAAAADGGEAATEHMDSGIPTMVVETVYPGTTGDRSTVSTRLFLPTRKVIEKARSLRGSITKEMMSTTGSKNILAMTFKQVVLRQLWSFELALLKPGSERDMNEIENPREVEAACTLSSSDENVISALAEVVCQFALENTKRSFVEDSFGKPMNAFLPWFRKPERIASVDNTVIMHKLNDYAFSQNSKKLLETFNLTKDEYKPVRRKLNFFWAKSRAYAELEKIGGPEFSSWVSEYVPAYKLEIDADQLGEVNLEGWKRSEGNTWEVVLTHSQMVEMANVLDIYYEDVYTLPDKELPAGIMSNFMTLPKTKRNFSFLRTLCLSIASGILLFTIGVLGRIYLPHFFNGKRFIGSNPLPPASIEVDYIRNQFLDHTKLGDLCIWVVKKIKDGCSLPEEIKAESGVGAWIGEVPSYLKSVDADTRSEEISAIYPSTEKNDAVGSSSPSVEDIVSYQVVLTLDGRIVGFQPTSRVAVNHWAANPLAKELHGGRKLSPGIFEPPLSIPFPYEVVVIELLMSVNPKAPFAFARPGV